MKCYSCDSENILYIIADIKSCIIKSPDVIHTGDVVANIGLGNHPKEINFRYCADCGQIQHEFPVRPMQSNQEPAQQPATHNLIPLVTTQVVEISVCKIIDEVVEYTDIGNEYEIGKRLSAIGTVIAPQDMEVLIHILKQLPPMKRANLPVVELIDTIDYIKRNYSDAYIRQNVVIQK